MPKWGIFNASVLLGQSLNGNLLSLLFGGLPLPISRILDGYASLGLIVIQFPASLLLYVRKYQRATEAQRLGNVKRKLSQVQTGTHNVADGKKIKRYCGCIGASPLPV